MFASTELAEFEDMGRSFKKKIEAHGKPPVSGLPELGMDDPLEFPRDKLEKTGVVLGEFVA